MEHYKHIGFEDRKRIEKLYIENKPVQEIANEIGVHRASIYNELIRGDTGAMDENGRCGYSAEIAQRRAYTMAARHGKKQY